MIRRLIDAIIRKCELLKYNIAFVDCNYEDLLSAKTFDYHLLKHKESNWFADPFVLDVEDNVITLLVEEFNYKKWRGEITKLLVDSKSYKLIKKESILKLSFHLSYPVIKRLGKKVYVYPESGESGCLKYYLYQGECLVDDQLLLEGRLADATITDLFGDEYLFCTKLPDCSGKKLWIYKLVDSAWVLFQIQEFDEKIARMAGSFFKVGDSVYRPAQDCNECYGHGTVIQKVELLDGKFVFEEINRYFSPDKRMNHGIHTLNSYKGITVVDMEGFEWPILAKFASLLRFIFKNEAIEES